MSRLVCACGKSYDVSARAPGARVRCPACRSILVVPAPRKMDPAARSASERLRRARGEPCKLHPKTLAQQLCERCQAWMCDACRAAPPSSHLCRACAPLVGATEALPVDFGVLATTSIAARLAARSLPWVFVLNLAAHTFKWIVALPFMILTFVLQPKDVDVTHPEVVLFLASYSFAALVISFFEVVLIPAADIVVFDAVMRGGPSGTYGSVLMTALRRAFGRWRALSLDFLLILAATLASLLVLVPFVLLYQLKEDPEVIAAGLVFTIPAVGLVMGAFGLSVPAVILEHRSAVAAFGRAWTLARLRPLAAWFFGTAFVFVGVLVSYRLVRFQQSLVEGLGLLGLVPALFAAFLADIAWPALLVSAYHGLVAEEAKLVGRRS